MPYLVSFVTMSSLISLISLVQGFEAERKGYFFSSLVFLSEMVTKGPHNRANPHDLF
jgi:hypothetical protein